MMTFIYRVYQLFIAVPITILMTIWTALVVAIGCTFGDGHYWGYYPGRWWAKVITKAFLLPVKVEGSENVPENQSYVFVANHQGAFDIFDLRIFGQEFQMDDEIPVEEDSFCRLCL